MENFIFCAVTAGKCYWERAIQHLHPLELLCGITPLIQEHTINAKAEQFQRRVNASEIAQA